MARILRWSQRKQSENDVAPNGGMVNKFGNEAHFLFPRNGSAHVPFGRMRNDPCRNSSRKGSDGTKICRRNAGRLFYRPSILQARLQILGLHPPSRAALERIAAGHVE